MDRRALGSTGFEVSRVILGCGSIGGIGSPESTRGKGLSLQEGIAQIDCAIELGVNLLDTANSYAGGVSEQVVGGWVSAHPDADVLIATKVGNLVEPGQTAVDLTSGHIARQIDASLARLGRIDLYLSHGPDPDTPIVQTLEAFAAVLEAGKATAIGACNVSAHQLEEALDAADRYGLPRYGWVQNEYNLLAAGEQADVLRVVRDHGLGYTSYSPLSGGLLTGRYRAGSPPPATSRMAIAPGAMRDLDAATTTGLRQLAQAADRRGVTMAALALAWVLTDPDVTAPLVAPRHIEQFADVTAALTIRLDADERHELASFFAS